MATVSSIVVRRRLASMRQVEEALARQTLYGGDVVTNLLEVAPPPGTDETALTAALAESLDLEPAPVDEVRAPDSKAVSRVPRSIAEEYGFVPIAIRDGTIIVALAEPLAEAAIVDLEVMLGAEIVQQAAPFVRLRQALERAYGVPMDRRTRRLALILDGPGHPAPEDAEPVPQNDARTETPRKSSAAAPSRPPPATTIRTSTPGADALRWFVKSARGDVTPDEKRRDAATRGLVPGARRRRGPFTSGEVDKIFSDPTSTDAVLGAAVEFAEQWFAYVALFLVHEDLAEGWEASGQGAAGDRVRKMGIPLDLPSMFATARETRAPIVQPRPRDGLDAVVAQDLDRPPAGDVLVAPVVVGKRVVALLYADDDGGALSQVDTAQVLVVIANAGAALARMILKKKGKGRAPAGGTLPAPARAPESDDRSERASALAKAFTHASRSQPAARMTPATGQRVAIVSEPIRKQTLPGIATPSAASRSSTASAAPAPAAPPSAAPVPAASAPSERAPESPTGLPLTASGEVPGLRDLEADRAASPMALPSSDSSPQSEDEAPTPLLPVRSVARPFEPVIPYGQPPPPQFAGRKPLGPIIPREEAPSQRGGPHSIESIESADVSDDELEELLELADRSNVVGFDDRGRPSERFEVYQPREPPRPLRRSLEHELPKVIVAIEPEYQGLVARLLRGGQAGEAASSELRRLGVAALPAIMDRFPGPTRVDRTTPIAQVPRPSAAGPLLSLLVALGRLALRDVLARTGDPLPETRFWATWLLTEIIDIEAASPLVPRLVDDDLAVRRAAWTAARMLLLADGRAGEVLLEPLVGVILDPGGGLSLRIRSARALGELRDRRAVEGLVFGLDAREPEIGAACHEALTIITRADPPRVGSTWQAWFAEHAAKSRIEWLIDALLDTELSNREVAAAELKDLTKQFFGYYANLPRREREEAHRRYAVWWREEGQQKFGGRV